MSKIGNYLKKIRKVKNLTLVQLEDISGVSNSHISRIERGLREPSPDTLRKLAEPLGIPYQRLLEKADYLENGKNDKEKTEYILSSNPELFELWKTYSSRKDMQLLFKKVKNMEPEEIMQVLRIIEAVQK